MPEPNATMVTRDPTTATYRSRASAQQITPTVLMHPAFSNTYAVSTCAGLLLIDPGLRGQGEAVHRAVRAWSEAPLHTVVYTHGHGDHAFGLGPFLAAGDQPRIVAQENCPARFRRYLLTNGLNACINQRQFAQSKPTFPTEFIWPTVTFRESLRESIGATEVAYFAAKGETDDHCIVWLPQSGYLFTGDLVAWHAPNCGNPQKVQRYPLDWAEALEWMAGLDAEWLFPGHGLVVHGRDAVTLVLTETAAYLRHLIDQVLERLNAGQTPEAIFHAVEPHPTLATRPYLHAGYDHPKFIVRNLIRLWGGWWNGNAADLLPAPPDTLAREIAELGGGVEALVARGRQRLEDGDAVLASHLAEWATQAAPTDPAAQRLKRDVYAQRLASADGTMERGIYRAAMNDARQALGEAPALPPASLRYFGTREEDEAARSD